MEVLIFAGKIIYISMDHRNLPWQTVRYITRWSIDGKVIDDPDYLT